jgi:RND family efflux transporter MFP subunit
MESDPQVGHVHGNAMMTSEKKAHIPARLLWPVLVALAPACRDQPPPPPPPPAVTVAQPVQRTVTDALELTGNTQAFKTVQLVARVEGYLEQVLFQDGQLVHEGQVLFRIQRNTYEDMLRRAEAAVAQQKALLAYTEIQLTRYANLKQAEGATQVDVDNWRYQRDSARANLQAAEAQVNLARLDLGYTEVKAPLDGRIDRRLKDPGNLVSPGQDSALAQLHQIDPIYVYFNISDRDLARLMQVVQGIPGQQPDKKWPISVGLPLEEGYPHEGQLDFASASLTATTGTLLMRGVFANPTGNILPGFYARVRVPAETRTAWLVPQVAVANDQQGPYVLIVNDQNVVQRRGVKTGPRVQDLRVIADGLQGTEWVITEGLVRAAPGRPVTPQRQGTGSFSASEKVPVPVSGMGTGTNGMKISRKSL